MSDVVSLKNNDRGSEHQVRAADGSSFQIQPGATVHNVDPKFLWGLPPQVKKIVSDAIAVESSITNPAVIEESGASAKSARSTPGVATSGAVIPNASTSTMPGSQSGGNKNASNS